MIDQKYFENHYVKQPYGHKLGLLCSVHWSVCHRGGKVRLRAGCHVLLEGGAYVFTPVRGASEAMLAAAGLVTVHQPNEAKVVEE